mgnify:CR=1 FL=1
MLFRSPNSIRVFSHTQFGLSFTVLIIRAFMATIPREIDEAAIVDAVRYKSRLVVVAENHSVIGGLGEAVASTLLRHRVQPAGFQLAGLPDAFLDAGALPTLHERYGISREALGARVKAWLG